MRRLKEKLKSQDGASLIMALLVFLLCVMVAASVLAAAASNAGKAKSNQVEQQKYLTLSSALRLVCGELEKVEYTGKYNVYKWGPSDSNFCCVQESGDFDVQTSDPGPGPVENFGLINISSLQTELQRKMDEAFRRQFKNLDGSAKAGYEPLGDAFVREAPIYLTVELPDGLGGYPYMSGSMLEKYKISKEVTVEIDLDPDINRMKLTAWLNDPTHPDVQPTDGSGIMIAYLKATASFSVPDIPSGSTGIALPNPAPALSTSGTGSVKWKLDSMMMTSSSP